MSGGDPPGVEDGAPETARRSPGWMLVVVTEGAGADPLLFIEGARMDPLSIGRAGAWPVQGAAILDEHAYVGFDGHAVFMRSADATNPVLVDGAALPVQWTKLVPGCRVRIANVVAELRVVGAAHEPDPMTPRAPRGMDDEATDVGFVPPVVPFAPLVAPGKHTPSFAADGEATRLGVTAPKRPPEGSGAQPGETRVLRSAETSPRPVSVAPPLDAPRGAGQDRASLALPDVVPPPLLAPAAVKAASSWQPRAIRVGIVSAGVLIAALFILRARGRKTPPTALPPATTVASVAPPVSAAVDGPPRVVVYPSPVRPIQDAGVGKRSDGGAASLERAAADAIHRGDLRAGADIYERLAAEQPDHPTFARAARLLRDQIDAGPSR